MADTRKDKRAPVALKVRFKSATVDEFIEQYSTDVSRGGIFVKSGRPMKVGTLLKFQFQLKDESPLIRGVGRVVWTREDDSDPEAPSGMGIKFIKMDQESREVLDKVLAGQSGQSRFEHGPGEGGEVDEPHPSDPPEGSFFPSTSDESDLPPPEDRTAVRHASEFLAGALSGITDEDAAREAAQSAEDARRRGEEIERERQVQAGGEAPEQPSIVVDPSLSAEEVETPRRAAGEDADDGSGREADEAGLAAGEETGASSRAASAASAAGEPESSTPPPDESPSAGPDAPTEPATAPMREESSGRGVVFVVLAVVVAVAAYLAFANGQPDQPAMAAGEVEPESEPEPEPEPDTAAAPEPTPEPPPVVAPEPGADAAAAEPEGGAADAASAAEKEDAAEPAPDVEMVKRRVVTVPFGAEVSVDDEPQGTAPVVVELPLGQPVQVRAKLPERAETVEEVTATEQRQPVRLVLKRLPYVLSVTTEPPGATVQVGKRQATSPAEITLGIPSGGRVIVLARKPGYVQARRAALVGQFEERDGAMRQTVHIELTERPARPARAKPDRAKPEGAPAPPKQPAEATPQPEQEAQPAAPKPQTAPEPEAEEPGPAE